MELTRTSAKDLHRNASTLLRRVRRGERFIIEWYEEDSALLLPMSDLQRLEEPVSEDRAPYIVPSAPQVELTDLALFLADGDAVQAARLLAQAAAELLKERTR